VDSRAARVLGAVVGASSLLVTGYVVVRAVDVGGTTAVITGTGPPTRVTTTVPTTTRPEALLAVDRELQKLPFGHIAFNVPRRLKLGQTVVIHLVLSLEEPLARVRKKVAEAGKVEGARVRVSDVMEAQLDGFGFEVNALSSARQAVSEVETTDWSWEIKATEGGSHRLTLTLSALIKLKGERLPRTVRTFYRSFTVHVSLLHRTTQFVGDHVEWLVGGLVAMVAAILGWARTGSDKQGRPSPKKRKGRRKRRGRGS
jgi:hypothetical protein